MRSPLWASILLTILLGACGGVTPTTLTPSATSGHDEEGGPAAQGTADILIPFVGAQPAASVTPVVAPAVATRTLEEQLDAVSRQATDIPATLSAIMAAPTYEPALATAATRRYQDNLATNEALAATRQAATILALPPLPGLAGFPEQPAPAGLAGVELPTTVEGVISLVYRMPEAIAGVPRTPYTASMGGHVAEYGEATRPYGGSIRMVLGVYDPTQYRQLPPGWSAAHSIAEVSSTPHEGMERGHEGHLYWVRSEGALGGTGPMHYTLLLGSDGSPWLFQLDAASPDELEALAAAIRAAIE